MEHVTFLENGTKVAAVNPKTYVFEPNMSRGLEDDLIRTVNIPAMVRLLFWSYADNFDIIDFL